MFINPVLFEKNIKLAAAVELSRFTMGEYGASLEELRALMEYRGAEAKEKIDADYGGITGLCERLKTDPNNGIPNTTTELERRRAVFGANEIPPHPPKCFLQLVWEALQVKNHIRRPLSSRKGGTCESMIMANKMVMGCSRKQFDNIHRGWVPSVVGFFFKLPAVG
ncbi:cation transporter/ATPase [Teladorsagia circumcincta]|uniref:Cation transporter/ATPase n=1 Tax=Teladorsagia circumcincta TaxID=45464 RepID=A0A2G9U896_TELCI|nr:cation transporter/ATPase [Teladorsagia circumcincta]